MATHSEHTAVIRGQSQTLGVAQGPVDAGMVRDAVVNNARHLHDEHGQIICTLAPTTAWTQASPSTSAFQLLDSFVPVEFPIHKRGDTGRSFLVVIHARVSISSAGTATFRFAIHPGAGAIDYRYPPLVATGVTTADELTTTNTTGEDVVAEGLYFTSAQLEASRVRMASKLGDGTLGSANMFIGAISVWAKSSAGAPKLHSLCAREYVGA